MSSQESNASSLHSILFDINETKDYRPLSLNEIRKQTEKCLQFEHGIDDYNENESDVSIETDSSESSDENGSDDETLEQKWKLTPNQEVYPEPFQQRVGPCHNLNHDSKPIDYFSIFWSDLLIDQIVYETNRSGTLLLN